METQKIDLTIKDGVQELRLGQLATPIDFNGATAFIGTETAPYSYYLIYADTMTEPVAIADIHAGTIRLTHSDRYDKGGLQVNGKIKMNPILDALHINSGKYLSPKDTADLLRKNRILFARPDDALELVSKLTKFKAVVNTALEQSDDNRANTKVLLDRTFDTDVPHSFTLSCPIVYGSDARFDFDVDIFMEYRNNDVRLLLDSVALTELWIKEVELLLRVQMDLFRDAGVPVLIQ